MPGVNIWATSAVRQLGCKLTELVHWRFDGFISNITNFIWTMHDRMHDTSTSSVRRRRPACGLKAQRHAVCCTWSSPSALPAASWTASTPWKWHTPFNYCFLPGKGQQTGKTRNPARPHLPTASAGGCACCSSCPGLSHRRGSAGGSRAPSEVCHSRQRRASLARPTSHGEHIANS
jgi:hypothetical protein